MKLQVRTVKFFFILFFGCMAPFRSASAGAPKLIPRSVIFGNPVILHPLISPDGTRYAYLAPSPLGVLNVWVKKFGEKRGVMITDETHRPIRGYYWSYDNRHILYIQDHNGDENFHVLSADIFTKTVKDLTPFPGVKAENIMLDRHHPEWMYVGLNKRDPSVFDMYKINLDGGAIALDTQNPGDVLEWLPDYDFVIRGAVAEDPNTGATIFRVRDAKDKPWRTLAAWSFEDSSSGPVAFSKNGKSVYATSSQGSDTQRLVRLDAESGKELETMASDPRSDVESVITDPNSWKVQAAEFDYLKPEWKFFDPAFKSDFEKLSKTHPGVIDILSRDRADDRWIVAYLVDDGPVAYYLYNRNARKAEFLFVNRPALENYTLSRMKPLVIHSRDGLSLVSYLTLPSWKKPTHLPMVLFVHGGPWARDEWGFDPVDQLLANRGYAVLQVNYRGSTGFGKNFLNAGNKEWPPGKMQADLSDAVAWAVKHGIADSKRIAIMGASYGGYATLAGLAFTPRLYACGVDIVGPTEVKTLLESIPPYWKPMRVSFLLRVGDLDHDSDLNRRISPLYHIDEIRVPLLIAQGGHDPRVKLFQSKMIVDAMRKKNLPVEYIVYPDEGHGFARPQNNLDFFGRTEVFLGKYLGGRVEPWKKVPGSSVEEH